MAELLLAIALYRCCHYSNLILCNKLATLVVTRCKGVVTRYGCGKAVCTRRKGHLLAIECADNVHRLVTTHILIAVLYGKCHSICSVGTYSVLVGSYCELLLRQTVVVLHTCIVGTATELADIGVVHHNHSVALCQHKYHHAHILCVVVLDILNDKGLCALYIGYGCNFILTHLEEVVRLCHHNIVVDTIYRCATIVVLIVKQYGISELILATRYRGHCRLDCKGCALEFCALYLYTAGCGESLQMALDKRTNLTRCAGVAILILKVIYAGWISLTAKLGKHSGCKVSIALCQLPLVAIVNSEHNHVALPHWVYILKTCSHCWTSRAPRACQVVDHNLLIVRLVLLAVYRLHLYRVCRLLTLVCGNKRVVAVLYGSECCRIALKANTALLVDKVDL